MSFLCSYAHNDVTFQLVCPPDYHLECGEDITDLSRFGSAYYWQDYVKYGAGLPEVHYHLNSCNTGHITRKWTVEDQYWNLYTCTQTIFIEGGDFTSADITWPKNELHLTGCDADVAPSALPYEYQEPKWNYVRCSQVASSYRDQVFNFGNDCKKVLRHWTVIDWCTYKAGGSKGYYTYTQTIKISKNVPPLVSCVKNVTVHATRCDSSYVSFSPVSVEGESCTGKYIVDHNSIFADTITSPDGVYPVGLTKVEYSVEYACGSEVKCQTEVRVLAPGPVPYCISDLNVVLMPIDTDNDGAVDDGMVEVWAKDLNIGSYHPCNNSALKFSFSADVNDDVRVFSCDEAGYNTVEMWITDNKGNQSYCLVNIFVQNNAGNIPNCVPDIGARYMVYGRIEDQNSEPLEDVIVTIKDAEPIYDYIRDSVETVEYIVVDSFYNQAGALLYIYSEQVVAVTEIVDSFPRINVHYLYTDQEGIFKTNEIPLGRNYQISSFKTGTMKDINGEDLKMLSDFIFEGKAFENPYSYLAADVNEDLKIDIEDYYILEELISEEEDEWPQERQWVFYEKVGMQAMTEEPLNDDLPTTKMIQDLQTFGNGANFMGILKGDISKFESDNQYDKEDVWAIEKRYQRSISVFPNPFSEFIEVNNPYSEEVDFELIGLDGRLILSQTLKEGLNKIEDLQTLERGGYIYTVINSTGSKKTGKLFKN